MVSVWLFLRRVIWWSIFRKKEQLASWTRLTMQYARCWRNRHHLGANWLHPQPFPFEPHRTPLLYKQILFEYSSINHLEFIFICHFRIDANSMDLIDWEKVWKKSSIYIQIFSHLDIWQSYFFVSQIQIVSNLDYFAVFLFICQWLLRQETVSLPANKYKNQSFSQKYCIFFLLLDKYHFTWQRTDFTVNLIQKSAYWAYICVCSDSNWNDIECVMRLSVSLLCIIWDGWLQSFQLCSMAYMKLLICMWMWMVDGWNLEEGVRCIYAW